ncbi:MAG: YqaE/Pmp3 family membrane protein [Saprospiraceae bacterium]
MKTLFTLLALFCTMQVFAVPFAVSKSTPAATLATTPEMDVVNELPAAASSLNIDDFLNLTPKKYKEITGEKLGFKNTLKLKAAQKVIKKKLNKGKAADIPKGAYIVLVILGVGWLVMGLMDDFSGNNWWVNLILTALCWLPGVIHGLVKMKEYY